MGDEAGALLFWYVLDDAGTEDAGLEDAGTEEAGPVDKGTEGVLGEFGVDAEEGAVDNGTDLGGEPDETGTEGLEAGPVLKGTDGKGALDETGTDGAEGGEDGAGTEALELLQGEQSKPTLWTPTLHDSWGELGATWNCTEVAPPHWVFWTELIWPALQETVWWHC